MTELEGCRLVISAVPLKLHCVERFSLQDRADQGVHLKFFLSISFEGGNHLGHVATEPEQPAT